MQWELTRSSPKVIRTCREFVESLPKVIGSLPRVHRELVEGDREFAGSEPRVCQKMIERLAESSLEDAEKFTGSSGDQLTCQITRMIVFVCLSVS
ncbi:hypothetical protein BHE74_00034724 [Ensete ventricosum]|nr:hypothetical protein GW17_00008897 [Ensete ventricosum]RWW58410.1 hypothetical protein BHE74_00034724 [Ensete ventricosum]